MIRDVIDGIDLQHLAYAYLINREILVYQLEKYGMIVDAAENGEIALYKIIEQTYDLILFDLNMPIMNGSHCVAIAHLPFQT